MKPSLSSNRKDDDEVTIGQIDSNEHDNSVIDHHDDSTVEKKIEAFEQSLSNTASSNARHTTSNCKRNVKIKRHSSSSQHHRHRLRRNNKKEQQHQDTKDKSALKHEYNVDHSCSTPLERLTRDVGNILRQWNIHQGCDRHVSLDWMNKLTSTTTTVPATATNGSPETGNDVQSLMSDVTAPDHPVIPASPVKKAQAAQPLNQVMSMDLCERGFANRSRRINVWMGDEDNFDDGLPDGITTSTPPPPSQPEVILESTVMDHSLVPEVDDTQDSPREKEYTGAQCIRSKKVKFQTVGFSPEINDDESKTSWKRCRYTIHLVLSLWDGPITPSVDKRADDKMDDVNDEDEEDNNGIPLSLRQNPSPSSFSLLGELGILSPCGTERLFFNDSNPTGKNVAFDRSRQPLRTGFGQDLSTLFNVGQHITLSLDTEHYDDTQSLYNHVYVYMEDQIRLANEARSASQKERILRWKKQYRNRAEKESKEEEEEVIDFESDIPIKDSPSPFDDSSDVTNRMLDTESDSFDEGLFQEEIDSYEDDTIIVEDYPTLNPHEMNNEVVSALGSILHTAVSLAASENECNFPVFGIWGEYKGGSIDSGFTKSEGAVLFEGGQCAAPTWITPSPPPQVQEATNYDEESKLFLLSPIIVGTCQTPTFRSAHRVYSISHNSNLPTHLSTLDGLAKIMLSHCACNTIERVALTAARHCYSWNRNELYPHEKRYQEWRSAGQSKTGTVSDLEVYREQCEIIALQQLERASTNSRGHFWGQSSPMWGPSDGNPLLSLSASVSWGVIQSETTMQGSGLVSNSTNPTSLLQLPLKRRSTIAPTPAEVFEMDHALQSAALNPVGVRVNDQTISDPREPIFFASATFDNNSPCATLSANTRCVLAAMIRCGTLGMDMLPGHLTKTGALSNFSPKKKARNSSDEREEVEMPESEMKLREAIKMAAIGSVTERLIDALDWGDTEIVPSSATEFRIESSSYPEPPKDTFVNNDVNSNMKPKKEDQMKGKSAPPGRLLSILSTHMAKLRTPPSMMRFWLSFVEDLRTRWDRNESLPNLGFIPGLDIGDDDNGRDHMHWRLRQSETRVLGHRADLAAFVNSSEPDPCREHCLINQKLQLFNICMECKVYTEYLFDKKMNPEQSSSEDSSDGEDFYDAPMDISADDKYEDSVAEMLKRRAALSTRTGNSRPGARCPVPHALPLIDSGDQVYAPYLQRTTPFTDDEEEKHNQMFGSHGGNGGDTLSIQERIQIAQRFQKPKLQSDMSSFKAANDGACFEDFIRWYGNPVNPLGEELNEESLKRKMEFRSMLSPEEVKTFALKEASDAISVLMNLRAFWEDTWDEAEAEAAFEQDPLFNPYISVEMILHSLETIHPALLMNQVLAVNMSNAKFVLATGSKQARRVHSIGEGFRNLKNAIDLALEALTRDCSIDIAPNSSDEKQSILSYLATDTITKCEEACNQIGEFEVLLSRSLALLEKLPGMYNLVDCLLQGGCIEGNFVLVKDPSDRDAFLGAIRSGQLDNTTLDPSSFFPDASMREYLISNNDRLNPCQLSARLVPSSIRGDPSSFNGSLLLALSSSERNN